MGEKHPVFDIFVLCCTMLGEDEGFCTTCLKNKLFLHVKDVMDKKLTLSLDEGVIAHAKLYAEKNKISLSKLIEAYLKSIIDNKTKNVEITPLVKSISGVIEVPSDFDLRDEYTKYLIEKYR